MAGTLPITTSSAGTPQSIRRTPRRTRKSKSFQSPKSMGASPAASPAGEGIADANSANQLAIAQILGPDDLASRLCSGFDDHRIPKAQFGLLVKRDGCQNILGRWRKHVPDSELANAIFGLVNRKRAGDLAGDGHEEFLQHLHAQASVARMPKTLKQFSRGFTLCARRCIECIDKDVGVHEFSRSVSAHGARRATRCACHRYREAVPIPAMRARFCVRRNTGDLRPQPGKGPPPSWTKPRYRGRPRGA
jgi:hypothetical protein